MKQRKDSIEQFIKGGRADLALREDSELKILESYLPTPVGEEEINAGLRANSPRYIGKVMNPVMRKFAGKRLDSTIVSEIVCSYLPG